MSGLRSLTAAQIIGQVDYLDVDFDPGALTVSQLLGILAYHNIRYPTPYTKPKLVQLFLDEIKPKASKLRKEKLKRENSLASDDGITDGVTGQPINGKGTSARRSSRRLSHAAEEDTVVQRPEQPKRRRSSAQPSLGRPAKGKERAPQLTLIEESEPEEDMPARKISRSNKADADSAVRRVSTEHADDSGWEDNNIFQSGAESSSPVRPSPSTKGRRKSAVSRKSRHSMSAPPQLSPPSSPPKAPTFQRAVVSPPQSKFEPVLPPGVRRQPLPATQGALVGHVAPERGSATADQRPHDSLDALILQNEEVGAELTAAEDEHADLGTQVAADSRHTIGGGPIDHHLERSTSRAQSRSYFLTVLYTICLAIGLTVVINFKNESQAIGYCDTGSNSNRALEEFQARLSAEASNRESQTFSHFLSSLTDGITLQDGTPSFPFSHIPLPHPSSCTPCPEYATCSGDTVTCNVGYILRPHPLLALLSPFGTVAPTPVETVWNALSKVANGLPGLGPVAFAPHCIEDPKRKRNIGALGKAIDALLSQERGRRVCAGGPPSQVATPDGEGGDARKWGVDIETLRETMKQKTSPHLLDTFDDTFNEAIQQLAQWGNVVFGEDMSGKRYLAHKVPNMTLNCQLTVKFREQWFRWRGTLFACLAGYCAVFIFRRSRAQRHIETKRVGELVQITLDTLRNQELAHHTDPVTAPQAYLSSIQLRDLILQDEHSISTRRRLWDQVERIVESNANVRANLEEVQGGDELRVWRWVGTAGRGPGYRKRVAERGGETVS